MTDATIIVATPYPADLDRWQATLRDVKGLRIVAHVPGMTKLINLVEHRPPNLVLLSSDLCGTPDFELVEALFRALDVRWMMFHSLSPNARESSSLLSRRNGGVFPVLLNGHARLLIQQVYSIIQEQQRPVRMGSVIKDAKPRRYKRLVLLGASTGGVEALTTIFSHFKHDCPPTIVVQHTGQKFGQRLASVLERSSGAKVRMFEPGAVLESGTVYLVAGLPHHVVLETGARLCLKFCNDPPMSGHCPSIDKMFLSAVPFGERVVAAILSGMGRDGADGLLALRNAGAQTFTQDRTSSIVYGMPYAAWSNGGAVKQLPLKDVGPRLLAEASK